MKHIIIIEDDIHLAKLMQENINTIKNLQCASIFTNPIEFLNSPMRADIYLLDIVMPEMNGLDAIEKILNLWEDDSLYSLKSDWFLLFCRKETRETFLMKPSKKE